LKKTTRLKSILRDEPLAFIMEAHNGLSAKIAEEAGFPAIWASGLSISAALGVRDNNEATWTQVLEVAEFMADATSVPILIDGDTGHGNFNTLRRLVGKLEQRGIGGICIEDKLFPKTNSFLRDGVQELADAEEFCGKLKAARDGLRDPDFVLVARTEALIAGHGLTEALRRAEAYRVAGADAVVIHSKDARPDEIFAFLREWANRLPIILIPTKYYATPTAAFREKKVAAVIWANHLLRGSLTRMQEIAARVRREESVVGVEDTIAPLAEVFRLQGDDELQAAEKRYLRQDARGHSAIILASMRGSALDLLTADAPKTLLKVGRDSLLGRIVGAFRHFGVSAITVVAGYKKEMIDVPGTRRVDNDDYASTGELVSLATAIDTVEGDTLVAFGDIIFRRYIVGLLVLDPSDVAIVVDTNFRHKPDGERTYDFVRASRPGSEEDFLDDEVFLEHAEVCTAADTFHGEWIGLMKLSAKGLAGTREFLAANTADPEFSQWQMTDLLNHFVSIGVKVRIHYIQGHWLDIDCLADLKSAERFLPA
jgi:phosphoenolpyruvate phosphomutase